MDPQSENNRENESSTNNNVAVSSRVTSPRAPINLNVDYATVTVTSPSSGEIISTSRVFLIADSLNK